MDKSYQWDYQNLSEWCWASVIVAMDWRLLFVQQKTVFIGQQVQNCITTGAKTNRKAWLELFCLWQPHLWMGSWNSPSMGTFYLPQQGSGCKKGIWQRLSTSCEHLVILRICWKQCLDYQQTFSCEHYFWWISDKKTPQTWWWMWHWELFWVCSNCSKMESVWHTQWMVIFFQEKHTWN